MRQGSQVTSVFPEARQGATVNCPSRRPTGSPVGRADVEMRTNAPVAPGTGFHFFRPPTSKSNLCDLHGDFEPSFIPPT